MTGREKSAGWGREEQAAKYLVKWRVTWGGVFLPEFIPIPKEKKT